MSKLDELRTVVNSLFESATEKQDIERLAQVNNSIKEVELEQQEMMNKNAELIKSYKELVKHTSFKDEPKPVDTQPTGESLSLEVFLKNFLSSQKK